MASTTLQRHLAPVEESHGHDKRLYVLDESSLASTKQLHAFLHRLGPTIACCSSAMSANIKAWTPAVPGRTALDAVCAPCGRSLLCDGPRAR
jgi:hypothetical protein